MSRPHTPTAKHEDAGELKPMERGHMYFLFRPKVDVEEAHSFKDVQKLYLWLAPERVEMADHVTHPLGEASGAPPAAIRKAHKATSLLKAESGHVPARHRLLILPAKKLPGQSARQPHWAFVDAVGDTVEEIKSHIGEFRYHTKTRGERTGHAARIVGEAIYEIAQDDKHTYLFYELEMPAEPDDPQVAFGIAQEGLMLVQVKNPSASSVNREGIQAAGLDASLRPRYPKRLQEAFKGIRVPETKFTHLRPEMLNYKGTELLLVGCKSSPRTVLGYDEVLAMETLAHLEAQQAGGHDKEQLEAETGVETKAALHHF